MLYYVETGSIFARYNGDLWEGYYISMEKTFDNVLGKIKEHKTLEDYQYLMEKKILHSTSDTGWGFEDMMNEIFTSLSQ
jgi:hypothetical protein